MKKLKLNDYSICCIFFILKMIIISSVLNMIVTIFVFIITNLKFSEIPEIFFVTFLLPFLLVIFVYNNEMVIGYRKFIPKMFYKNKFKKHQKYLNGKLCIESITIDLKNIKIKKNKKTIKKLYTKINNANSIFIHGKLYFDKKNFFEIGNESIVGNNSNPYYKDKILFNTGYWISKQQLLDFLQPLIDEEPTRKIKDVTFVLNQKLCINWITNSFFKDEYFIQIKDTNHTEKNITDFDTNKLCEIFGKTKNLGYFGTGCQILFFKQIKNSYVDLHDYTYLYNPDYEKLIQFCKNEQYLNLNQLQQSKTIVLY